MGLDWIVGLGQAIGDTGFVVTVFLLSLRLGALLLLTPILYAAAVPAMVRVLIVVGLAVALAAGLPPVPESASSPSNPADLMTVAVAELALGATLAFGVFAAFAAISMAGRLIDVQIGFGIAQVFDPATQRQIPVIQSAFDHLGVLVFFLVNGHHALLRAVSFTLERFPPGRPWPLEAAAPMVIKQMGGVFGLGFALAAPVIACLLLVELAMGVVARNLPQVNMFVLGIPVKIAVGLVMLSLWFAGMGDAMSRVYAFIVRSWEAGFAAMPALGGQ
jgi:flagellar biosynthetic protein FliR